MSAKKIPEALLNILSSRVLLFVILVVLIIILVIATLLPLELASLQIYNTIWFYFLLGCLFLSLCACATRNLPLKPEKTGFYLIHLSILIILIGCLAGIIYTDKGYFGIYKGQSADKIAREDNTFFQLPFQIKLNNFYLVKHKEKVTNSITITDKNEKILLYRTFQFPVSYKLPESGLDIEILKVIPDMAVDKDKKIYSKSDKWNNPAIMIKIGKETGWIFSGKQFYNVDKQNNIFLNYACEVANASVKDYKSDISIIKDGKVVLNKIIEVNRPLEYNGYKIYQFSFDQDQPEWAGLFIKKDFSSLIVFPGYLILIAGVLFQLYLARKFKEPGSC